MIDDDELTLESALRRLRKSTCSLLTLTDGESLVEVLATHPVRALIIDYHLARGTGLDLVRCLKQKQIELPDTLILATVCTPAPDVSSSALELGMRLMLKDELLNQGALEALAG